MLIACRKQIGVDKKSRTRSKRLSQSPGHTVHMAVSWAPITSPIHLRCCKTKFHQTNEEKKWKISMKNGFRLTFFGQCVPGTGPCTRTVPARRNHRPAGSSAHPPLPTCCRRWCTWSGRRQLFPEETYAAQIRNYQTTKHSRLHQTTKHSRLHQTFGRVGGQGIKRVQTSST